MTVARPLNPSTIPGSSPASVRAVSIVIPAYNEEKRLLKTLEAIAGWAAKNLERTEIIVVDDGSRDRTVEVATEFACTVQEPVRFKVIQNGVNRGKGASVRSGILAASEPWILMSDADLSTPIEELEKLAQGVQNAQIAIGSRAAAGARIAVRQPIYRELMGKTFNGLVRTLVTGGISDTQCGFKLFGREVAREIFARARVDRFAFDVELIYLARKLGFTIAEVPVEWHNSPDSTVDPIRDSARMFFDILRIRRLHRGSRF